MKKILVILALLFTANTQAEDIILAICSTNKTAAAVTNVPFPVIDFGLKDDYLNADLRDYMGRDWRGNTVREQRGPTPLTFPALVDCESGVLVRWTGSVATSTNALAAAILASDFHAAQTNEDALVNAASFAEFKAHFAAKVKIQRRQKQ